MKDWTKVRIPPPLYEGTVRRAGGRFDDYLENTEAQFTDVTQKLKEAKMKKVQQYTVDVTLDPDTAHPKLIVSEDGKQVQCNNTQRKGPDNPERFSRRYSVLGKQGFSSGKFYFEVEVKGKTEWDVGVATKSINRKREDPLSPEQGYWAIGLRNKKYTAHLDPPVKIRLTSELEKVGVFVDYDEGRVSFYDVDDSDHIYCFNDCCFTEKLHPFCSPGSSDGGKNSTPRPSLLSVKLSRITTN